MTRQTINIFGLSLVIALTAFSCKKDPVEVTNEKSKNKIERAGHSYGSLEMVVDPSFKNVAQSLADMYMVEYPDVKITLKEEIEEKAIKDFYEGESSVLMVTKPLTKEQQDHLFAKTDLHYIASQIGLDAAIFITSTNNPITSISVKDIKTNLYQEKPAITFVFDHPNSANFNTVNEKLELKVPKDTKVAAMGDAEKVIDYVQKNSKAIGIIGLNVLSDKNNPTIQKYLENVKVLEVANEKGEAFEANNYNLRNGLYAFYRPIYILKNEKGFGIGAGLTRFTGSQRGQKIILRENLQPYYLFKREVMLKSSSVQ